MSLPIELQEAAAVSVTTLTAMESSVQVAQELFRAHRGQYCQLPSPHDSPPADGEEQPCDWNRSESDVGLSWSASHIGGHLPSSLAYSPHCDVSHGPDGPRYAIALSMWSTSTRSLWQYQRIYGPHGHLESLDWREVIDNVV